MFLYFLKILIFFKKYFLNLFLNKKYFKKQFITLIKEVSFTSELN